MTKFSSDSLKEKVRISALTIKSLHCLHCCSVKMTFNDLIQLTFGGVVERLNRNQLKDKR